MFRGSDAGKTLYKLELRSTSEICELQSKKVREQKEGERRIYLSKVWTETAKWHTQC